MKKFDLTTQKGMESVKKFISDNPLFVLNPALGLGKYLIDKIFDSSKTYEAQREVAAELIKKGKEQGVDEMEITLNNVRGGKFNIPVEDAKIDVSVGTDEKIHVRVKYK